MQDEHKVKEIELEHQIFCITQGIKNLCSNDPNTWDYNEDALRQSLNLIELSYRKLKKYDAFALTNSTYKIHMHKTFWNFYGVEWENMNSCTANI